MNRDVIIHLRHLIDGEISENVMTEQNLTLILKCHVPVDWIIESSGIIGSLHVVVIKLVIILIFTWKKDELIQYYSSDFILLLFFFLIVWFLWDTYYSNIFYMLSKIYMHLYLFITCLHYNKKKKFRCKKKDFRNFLIVSYFYE